MEINVIFGLLFLFGNIAFCILDLIIFYKNNKGGKQNERKEK